MKPFNSREPVQKRDGRKARIIGWDAKGVFPLTALVEVSNGGEEPETFTVQGSFYNGVLEDGMDLINVPKPPTIHKVQIWLAVSQLNDVRVYTARKPVVEEGWKAVKEFNLEVEVP